jgi:cell division transport system permease protein
MGAAWTLLDYEPELVGVITTDVLLWMAVSVLLFGLLITYLCAYLSINKYLRMRAGTLYYL